MELSLYVKEGNNFKFLRVPVYVVKDLLRDRLSKSELDRIDRLSEKIEIPKMFTPGSVVVDFSNKTAQCYQTGINFDDLEPTWKVNSRLKIS